jgi:hypothetical protein
MGLLIMAQSIASLLFRNPIDPTTLMCWFLSGSLLTLGPRWLFQWFLHNTTGEQFARLLLTNISTYRLDFATSDFPPEGSFHRLMVMEGRIEFSYFTLSPNDETESPNDIIFLDQKEAEEYCKRRIGFKVMPSHLTDFNNQKTNRQLHKIINLIRAYKRLFITHHQVEEEE